MKVYWLENQKGEYYANARYFTAAGPPKLYGSEAKLRASLGVPKSGKWATMYKDPPGTLPEGYQIVSGTLVRD